MKLARMLGVAALATCAAFPAAAAPPTAPAIEWMPAKLDSNATKLTWNMWWGVRGTRWEVWDGPNKLVSSSAFITPSADPNFSQKGETPLSLGAGSHALKVLLCNADGCTASGVTTVTAPVGGGATAAPGTPVAAAPTKPVIDWMPAEFDDGTNVAIGWNMWWGTTGTSWELWDGGAKISTSTSFGASANPGNAQNGRTTATLAKGSHSLVVKLCNAGLCTASDARAVHIRNGPAGGGGGTEPPASGTLADCRTARIGQPVSAACLAGLDAAKFGGPAGSPKLDGRELMTYFAEWGTWGNGDPMQGRNFNPGQLPAAELTRVNYAFLVFSGTGGDLMLFDRGAALDKAFATDSWDGGDRGLLKQFWLLKARFPHLKVYFAVGGWNHTGPFPQIADDPVKRARLVQSAYDFVTAYGFDGIDIDWEYPGHAGNVTPTPRDRANFTSLMCELSARFKPKGLGVSFAAGANPLAIAGVDYPSVLPCVTSVNVMTYDFNGTWSTQVGHNAPLYNNRGESRGQGDFNVHDTVMNILAAIQRQPVGKTAMSRDQRLALFDQVPATAKAKIVIGMPFYGRGWSRLDRNPTEADIWASGAGAAKGSWEHVAPDGAGMADANDLLDIAAGRLKDYLPPQPARLWDRYACVPMYVDRVPAGKPRGGETFAYSYDDAESLQLKAAYVRDRGLGGVMSWEADAEPADHRLTAALARGLKGQAPAAACLAGGTDTIQ